MDVTAPPQTASQIIDVSDLTEILASSSTSKRPVEVLSKPPAQKYLSHLTSLPLSDLLTEPAGLQTQAHHLTSSLTSLTHTSYPTFLSLHRNTTSLTDSLSSLSTSLDELLHTSLPALEECAAGWKERTDSVLRERSKARVVLEQHDKIRDLLEIPLLIDTCVRNGYFAEALSLASHAKSLAANSSSKPTPLILSSILSEVHQSTMQMLLSLLATLYEPNRKLPALWKAVNFLRKMDAFGPSSPSNDKKPNHLQDDCYEDDIPSEEQIALSFLVGRESCLKSSLELRGRDITRLTNSEELEDREKDDLARYLKKYNDVWREGVYDIISQYSTIFLEHQSSTTSTSPTKMRSTASDLALSKTSLSVLSPRLHTLLTTYAVRALTSHLLPILSLSLPRLSLSLLPSLLTQLTYCSNAFTRVGLDFSGILVGLFSRAVSEIVTREMQTLGRIWSTRIKNASSSRTGSTTMTGNSRRIKELPTKWLITASLASSPPIPPPPSSSTSKSPLTSPILPGPAHIPPPILASYPPLAEHTNALLGVLNGLRLLAPPSILSELIKVLEEDVLAAGGEALHGYIKAAHVRTSMVNEEETEREEKVARASGEVYFRVFVPFLRRALLEGIYGLKDNARDMEDGSQVEKLQNVIREWEEWLEQVEGTGAQSNS